MDGPARRKMQVVCGRAARWSPTYIYLSIFYGAIKCCEYRQSMCIVPVHLEVFEYLLSVCSVVPGISVYLLLCVDTSVCLETMCPPIHFVLYHDIMICVFARPPSEAGI